MKPSGYHRGTEPVWIQARDSGALQPFDRISRKQVGVELFATVFWKTKRDGVEDSTHHDLQTHIGDKSRFTLQDKHV